MSRTFRRKHHEAENPKWEGSKAGGFYTDWDDWVRPGLSGHGGHPIYRAMTPAEKAARYWDLHSDHCGGIGRKTKQAWRHCWEKTHRADAREQLTRYIKDPDFEVQLHRMPEDHWWCYS